MSTVIRNYRSRASDLSSYERAAATRFNAPSSSYAAFIAARDADTDARRAFSTLASAATSFELPAADFPRYSASRASATRSRSAAADSASRDLPTLSLASRAAFSASASDFLSTYTYTRIGSTRVAFTPALTFLPKFFKLGTISTSAYADVSAAIASPPVVARGRLFVNHYRRAGVPHEP